MPISREWNEDEPSLENQVVQTDKHVKAEKLPDGRLYCHGCEHAFTPPTQLHGFNPMCPHCHSVIEAIVEAKSGSDDPLIHCRDN